MATKKLHIETLALHVGQETPDPATDARAVPMGCLRPVWLRWKEEWPDWL